MFKYFKCNVLGGFRLIDINKKFKQGEYFYLDKNYCETSRAVKGALNIFWMIEVSEEEASKYISIPFTPQEENNQNTLNDTSVQEINVNIETKQAARTFKKHIAMQKQKPEEKPCIPNFNEAERKMRERQNDITTKGEDEILKSPVEFKNILKNQENDILVKNLDIIEVNKEKTITNIVNDNLIKIEELKEEDSLIKQLYKEGSVDNSSLAVPDLNEKEKIKKEIKTQLEKKVSNKKNKSIKTNIDKKAEKSVRRRKTS